MMCDDTFLQLVRSAGCTTCTISSTHNSPSVGSISGGGGGMMEEDMIYQFQASVGCVIVCPICNWLLQYNDAKNHNKVW